MTRLAFSGMFLDQPNTGTGQYSSFVLQAMLRQSEPQDRWLILVATDEAEQEARRLCEGHPIVEVRRLQAPESGKVGKLWLEQVGVPNTAQRWKADVLHIPYLGPPSRSPVPLVVTIHDLIMLVVPEHRGDWRVQRYTRLATRGALRASRILADSASTRQDIIRLLGAPPEQVETILLAVDHDLYKPAPPRAREVVRARYGVPDEPFVLYFGGFDRRKNVPRLLEAFAGADTSIRLVLAGRIPEPGGLFPDIPGAISRLGLANRVQTIGFVQDQDKPALYSAARFVVYPSMYEGFGLPVLEAMACGAPVISSNRSSLPEIYGEAALGIDPTDTRALTRAIEELARDSSRREQLRSAGLERARAFSWDACARQTLAALRVAVRS